MTTTRDLVPTPEQLHALELFRTERSLAIQARAGAGKTSTLAILAHDTPRRGLYVAFNKSIVADVGPRMPGSVVCSTAHSLAYRAVGAKFRHRLNGNRIRSNEIARILRLDPFVIKYGKQTKVLQPGYLGGLAMRAIAVFCNSADDTPSAMHVPYVDGIDEPRPDGRRGWDNNRELGVRLEPALKRAWEDLSDLDGQLRYSHDVYLKTFALGRPQLGFDYILADEAQDLSPVMVGLLFDQQNTQIVAVGDSCQPTGTLVSVPSPDGIRQVPIETLAVGDLVVSYDLARSYLRRGGRPITGITRRPFDGQIIEVHTSNAVTSYTPDHRCIARVSDALAGRHVVYLMARGTSYRIGKVAGTYGSQGGGLGLPLRARSEGADAAWVLSVHDTAADALIAEAITAHEYGIPTLTFRATPASAIGQEGLDKFWDAVGNNTLRAHECLLDHGRMIQYPLWDRNSDGNLLVRRAQIIRACNLMDGMSVLPLTGALNADGKRVARQQWTPITVARRWYTGDVWSMDVDVDETYVGDGIVTHNCQNIYGWRGSVDAMSDERLEQHCNLSMSFRFGPAVADVANRVLGMLDSPPPVVGSPKIASTVGPVPEPDAILCRTNAAAVDAVLSAQAAGQRPHLVGGGTEVVSFAKAAQELMDQGRTWHPELACFDSWNEVIEYVEHDEMGAELRLMTKLVETYGVPTILRALDRMAPEASASVIVSTAHKAKGREWVSVRLAGDFPQADEDEPPAPAELRLLYVAATRAKRDLDVTACTLLHEDPVADPMLALEPLAVEPLDAKALTEKFGTRAGR